MSVGDCVCAYVYMVVSGCACLRVFELVVYDCVWPFMLVHVWVCLCMFVYVFEVVCVIACLFVHVCA